MLRPAYLAGQWYPADERGCRAAIEGHAAEATPEQGPFRGAIAPHAGWSYSGRAAIRAYAWLWQANPEVDLVVVFGSHRGADDPSTIFRAQGWNTPLGPRLNCQPLADQLAMELRLRDEPETPLRPDNGAELHMPLVGYFWPQAEILMLGVAAHAASLTIGAHIGTVVREHRRQALFIGSTDLTHYGPNYGFECAGTGDAARRWVRDHNDREFIDRVLARDAIGALTHGRAESSACCPGAVAACIAATDAYRKSKKTRLVDHYLSYDVFPNDSFVGYAGLVL